MSGAIPPLPQYAFRVWCSVKTKKNMDDGGSIPGRGRKGFFFSTLPCPDPASYLLQVGVPSPGGRKTGM
jgi:hypothetical protein